MDRPEPGLVKWSPHTPLDSFIHINLQHRVIQLYEPTGHAKPGRFDYERISRHDDFPPLTTYDWSPANPGLLAVGTGSGVVNLLKIDDGSNAYLELGLKMNRICQAVAFNTTGLLAVGLDRVRMDQSLQVWDVSRMTSLSKSTDGFPKTMSSIEEPRYRLEPSVSVSSIKFFEDSPQTLVAGIRAQGLRLHDLRDPHSVITFQTKCNNNLAIDYADPNFFASSALDHPGVMVWDRRATSRPVATHAYLQAVEGGDLPWGGALRLDQVIDTDSDPSLAEGKHSLIRSLRYCRDHRGLLAVLSRTGQLKVLETNRENPASGLSQSGPELLSVQRSHELDLSYRDTARKTDRIVSFDWVTLPSPVLRPRLFVLRANGNFDILETPSNTSDHVHKLVPWKAPHRGLEGDYPYHSIMQFEPSQAPQVLGPLLAEEVLSHAPIFGNVKADLAQIVENASSFTAPASTLLERPDEVQTPLPDSFYRATTIAAKLRSLRDFVRETINLSPSDDDARIATDSSSDKAMSESTDLSMALKGTGTCREMHENLLNILPSARALPQEAMSVTNHVMLLRAKEKYLLDPNVNRHVVSDDPWLRFVWDWVADAEQAADDSGMVISNMDLSYLGVQSVWMNDLGKYPERRLLASTTLPEPAQWERGFGQYCKKRRLPKFDGVQTKRPHHRQLCLEMCSWGEQQRHDPAVLGEDKSMREFPSTVHTMIASRALFRGDTKQAIEILKKGSAQHPELLFVSLALQLVGRGGRNAAREQLEFDETIATKTDPYLRAISSLIATGDWTAIANQRSLPLSDRTYIAVRNLPDDALTSWLQREVDLAVQEGDVEAIALTGISEPLVDVFARYVQKFHDIQTATLLLSICCPRYVDDIRCRAWRNAYRAYLQRHKLFFQRTKFEVETTKRSKRDGVPTLKPPSRQIALRCIFCDAETSLANQHGTPVPASTSLESRNPMMAASINAGVSCPSCGRHLPRCVVCLEVVGIPRDDRPRDDGERGGLSTTTKMAGKFPTFCLKCEHVLHLNHAREWFARHVECPVPECRCRCNSRANPELSYP